MASTIEITFNTQALDFSPITRGQIDIAYNNGVSQTLRERLTTGVSTTGFFKEVAWASGQETVKDSEQAVNFAQAFNRDYKDVGGVKNLGAIANDNVVTITAKTGIFDSFAYTGNVLVVNQTTNNGAIETPKVMTITRQNTGDCANVDYTITASGGSSPYSVRKNGVQINNSWTGTSYSFSLERGVLSSVEVLDFVGEQIGLQTIVVPRKLIPSEFKIRSVDKVGGSDITIENVNPVVGTTPISYSVDGGAYQTSDSFPGMLEGTYSLDIKDVYGCVVSKTFEVRPLEDTTVAEKIRYFSISDFNSISFSRCQSFDAFTKKNFSNTLSGNELSGINYQAEHQFISSDIIATQFKSSYPFHIITLRGKDGSKTNIPSIMIQENLGSEEKVDCKIFPTSVTGVVGVYFDGGNEYEPFTLTIKGSSPHINNLPDWASEGQVVDLGTLGEKEIKGIGYDADLDKYYFKVEATIFSASNDTVQVTYNRHNYNLFQFYTYMTQISDRAIITIECGFEFDEIELTYVSEPIQRIEDTDKHLLIEWTGYKNLGDMVFTNTGYEGKMRVVGKLRSFAKSEAETFDGDDRSYSLKQSAGLGKRLNIELLSSKLWHKLNLASGIAGNGLFKINNLELVRTKPMDQDELGESNYSNISVEFNYGGDSLSIKADEIVLNPSTGVVGGGGSGKEGSVIVLWDEKERLSSEDGKMLVVGGDFISFTN